MEVHQVDGRYALRVVGDSAFRWPKLGAELFPRGLFVVKSYANGSADYDQAGIVEGNS